MQDLQAQLLVVDVYSEWAGPCHAMEPLINKMMIQMTRATGRDLMQYATACADLIPDLEPFRNICKWVKTGKPSRSCLCVCAGLSSCSWLTGW